MNELETAWFLVVGLIPTENGEFPREAGCGVGLTTIFIARDIYHRYLFDGWSHISA